MNVSLHSKKPNIVLKPRTVQLKIEIKQTVETIYERTIDETHDSNIANDRNDPNDGNETNQTNGTNVSTS